MVDSQLKTKTLNGGQPIENKDLEWWTANADCHFLMSADDSLTMTKDLQAVLEERRLDRHEILKVSQRYGTFKQLPTKLVRKVSEYELMRIGHEVVLIKLIANVLRSHLKHTITLSHKLLTQHVTITLYGIMQN